MLVGNLDITVSKIDKGRFRLTVQGRPYGVTTDVTLAELHRLAAYLAPPSDNGGLDMEMVGRIISVGIRSLAKGTHPDTETGSTEEMARINATADQMRERIRG